MAEFSRVERKIKCLECLKCARVPKVNLNPASGTMSVVYRSLRKIGVIGGNNLKIGITISPYRR